MTSGPANPAEALGHLRRYSREAFYGGVLLCFALPGLALLNGGVPAGRLIPLLAGWLVFVAVFVPGTLRIMADPWRVRPLWQALGLYVLGGALTTMATMWSDTGALWAVLPGLALAELIVNRALKHAWELILLGALVLTGGVIVAFHLADMADRAPKGLAVMLIAGATAYLQETTVRLWRSSLELDRAREEAGELATVRERLRLSQDLHDILGHALEVVSLKSELAARLSTVDPSRAHAEMVEVQELARGALQDVRTLVHAQRHTDLAVELVGARKLLDSADIACEVSADPAGLSEPFREVLGWVLREAVTNLLRHADARRCRITLRQDSINVVLIVANDGVLGPAGKWGAGLTGLAERVAGIGGDLTARVENGEFVVTVALLKGVPA